MQITTLTFRFPLHPGDIRAFRAAIVEVIGLGHQLFHGHDNSQQGVTAYSNAYPLIRFAVQRGRAQIIGMGAGADALLRHLLPLLPPSLVIAGRPCDLSQWDIHNSEWQPQIDADFRPFGLYQWIALNKKNYTDWKQLEDHAAARQMLLNRCLTGQLRALAEAADPRLDRSRIEARILRQDRIKRIHWHNNHFVSFNVVAESNFLPPLGLGLGRCHSFGFGEVCSPESYRSLTAKKHANLKQSLEEI